MLSDLCASSYKFKSCNIKTHLSFILRSFSTHWAKKKKWSPNILKFELRNDVSAYEHWALIAQYCLKYDDIWDLNNFIHRVLVQTTHAIKTGTIEDTQTVWISTDFINVNRKPVKLASSKRNWKRKKNEYEN